MNETPQDRARERSREEPGAHSGAEDPAHRRTVPGTASAAEGYRPGEGTAGGEPLAGVRRTDEEETGGKAGAGDEENGDGGTRAR